MHHLLCIDIGNTNIVIALMQGENMLDNVRIASTPMLDDSEYAEAIRNMLSKNHFALTQINGIVISSVVPRLTSPLQKVSHELFDLEALIIDHTLAINLKIKYDDPAEVGADRICNAVGALNRYKAPLIVVDMGTATTFDVVSEDREYLGGVIMPGLETAGHDLFKRAAKLSRVRFDFPDKVIGTRTKESLQSGLMWGTVDQIDGLIQRISKEWNKENITIIATGGLSEVIEPHSRYIHHVNKALTLLGMIDIYHQVHGDRS